MYPLTIAHRPVPPPIINVSVPALSSATIGSTQVFDWDMIVTTPINSTSARGCSQPTLTAQSKFKDGNEKPPCSSEN